MREQLTISSRHTFCSRCLIMMGKRPVIEINTPPTVNIGGVTLRISDD